MISVTCAIILNNKNEVLAAQRSSAMSLPLKWEFPGGKLEEGETLQDCLKREIQEELNIVISVEREFGKYHYNYPDFGIELYPFVCHIISGELKLIEHKTFKWLKLNELPQLDWAEADIEIVKDFIANRAL